MDLKYSETLRALQEENQNQPTDNRGLKQVRPGQVKTVASNPHFKVLYTFVVGNIYLVVRKLNPVGWRNDFCITIVVYIMLFVDAVTTGFLGDSAH